MELYKRQYKIKNLGNITLRDYNSDDEEIYCRTNEENFAKYYIEYYGEYTTKKAKTFLQKRISFLKTLLLNEEIIGFVAIEKLTCELLFDYICIDKKYQKKGIFKKIIQSVIMFADKQNFSIKLTVYKSNPAFELYQKLGFYIYDETASDYFMFRPRKKEKLIHLTGTHYEINYKIGQLYKNEFEIVEEYLKALLKNKNIADCVNKNLEFLKTDYPHLYLEYKGKSDGCGAKEEEYFLNTFFEAESLDAEKCSDVVLISKNKKFLFHNEDGNISTINYPIVYNYENNRIFDYSCFDSLIGSTITARKNYVFTCNYIYNKNFDFNNIPTYVFLRILSDSKTADEFIENCNKLHIVGSVSLNLFDKINNKIYSIEKVRDRLSIKEINENFYRTNHLVHDNFNNEKMSFSKTTTSLSRYKLLDEKIKNQNQNKSSMLKMMRFFDCLNKNSILQKPESTSQNKTLATFVCSKKQILMINDKNQKLKIKNYN